MQNSIATATRNRSLSSMLGVSLLTILTTVLCSAAAPTVQAGEGVAVTHSFLGVGKANKTVIVGEDGTVEWKFNMPASDGWVLPNGNVLLALYGTKGFPDRKSTRLNSSHVVISYAVFCLKKKKKKIKT